MGEEKLPLGEENLLLSNIRRTGLSEGRRIQSHMSVLQKPPSKQTLCRLLHQLWFTGAPRWLSEELQLLHPNYLLEVDRPEEVQETRVQLWFWSLQLLLRWNYCSGVDLFIRGAEMFLNEVISAPPAAGHGDPLELTDPDVLLQSRMDLRTCLRFWFLH